MSVCPTPSFWICTQVDMLTNTSTPYASHIAPWFRPATPPCCCRLFVVVVCGTGLMPLPPGADKMARLWFPPVIINAALPSCVEQVNIGGMNATRTRDVVRAARGCMHAQPRTQQLAATSSSPEACYVMHPVMRVKSPQINATTCHTSTRLCCMGFPSSFASKVAVTCALSAP